MKKKILLVGAAVALAVPIFAFADSNKDSDYDNNYPEANYSENNNYGNLNDYNFNESKGQVEKQAENNVPASSDNQQLNGSQVENNTPEANNDVQSNSNQVENNGQTDRDAQSDSDNSGYYNLNEDGYKDNNYDSEQYRNNNYHPCYENGGMMINGRHGGMMRGYYNDEDMPMNRWDREGSNYDGSQQNYNSMKRGQHHGWNKNSF